MARRRENNSVGHEETLEKKRTILDALNRATGGAKCGQISDNLDAVNVYYTLSPEEIQALLSGDVAKIESWVNNLDRQHATWLLRQLIKERW